MRSLFAVAIAAFASTALAQDAPAPEFELVGGSVKGNVTIAVPPMPTPNPTQTAAGNTGSLGAQVAEVVAADLRSSGQFTPLGPSGVSTYPYVEATAPAFPRWRGSGAQALVSGFVEARPDGRLTVGCYLFDVTAGRELARQGYVVAATEWRRAAHKCADTVYARLSGEGPMFDSRVVYVAETGPKNARVKRIALMDADGSNHRYLTEGKTTALNPRFSPDGRQLVYTSYLGRMPRVFVIDIASGNERMLVPGRIMTFAPRFSPDGRNIIFSMAQNGNTDLYVVNAYGGPPRRLTSTPGADTSPSYSPDGSRIVFESDRSGTQQLYVMNADGSGQRRISFGGGRYASPVWSPKGNLIAFTRIGGSFNIGVMDSSGGNVRTLSDGWQDEGPSWAPNGQFVMFHRTTRGSGQSVLYAVPITGGRARRLPTPQDGSDPSWSPLLS